MIKSSVTTREHTMRKTRVHIILAEATVVPLYYPMTKEFTSVAVYKHVDSTTTHINDPESEGFKFAFERNVLNPNRPTKGLFTKMSITVPAGDWILEICLRRRVSVMLDSFCKVVEQAV
jgi:hypothetical protein